MHLHQLLQRGTHLLIEKAEVVAVFGQQACLGLDLSKLILEGSQGLSQPVTLPLNPLQRGPGGAATPTLLLLATSLQC